MPILKFRNPETKKWEEINVVTDGVTFIPSVAEDGTLSWSNNGHLENPDPVMLDSNSVVIKDTKEEFPVAGNINLLYISRKTNTFYRWDKTSKKYIEITTGGGGPAEVEISKKEGNILKQEDDGLYVPGSSILSQLILKDETTGTLYEVGMENGKLYFDDEPTSTEVTNIILTDNVTKIDYRLGISNGKLFTEEV